VRPFLTWGNTFLARFSDSSEKTAASSGIVNELRIAPGRQANAESERELRFADLVLNEATREVWRGSIRVDLTPTEFNLLRYFLLNPRRVLSKQQIIDRVWAEDFGGDPSIVETYVSYLRRKLEPGGPRLIHTVRLVGYALREADA
jgi:two-component system, OmpR family, response regulator